MELPAGPPLSETPRFVALEAASLVTAKAIEFGHLPYGGVKEFMGDMLNVAHEFLTAEESPSELPASGEPAHLSKKQIKDTIGEERLTCLECGFKGLALKLHLRAKHSLTPAEYKAKWGLPLDYPIVHPKYSELRAETAKKHGLGQKGAAAREANRAGEAPKLKAVASSKPAGKKKAPAGATS
jgi:predicted transcriptional regulator